MNSYVRPHVGAEPDLQAMTKRRWHREGPACRPRGNRVGCPRTRAQREDKDDDRKYDMLNGPRDGSEALRTAVPVHEVCNIKQLHAAGLARVGNGEDALQKPVEIGDGNHAAFELERLVLGIPPAMGNACRKHGRLTGAQHAGDDLAFLALDQVNMQRLNAALEFKDDLIAVAHTAHDEDFAGVGVFQAKRAGYGTHNVNRPGGRRALV